MDGAYDLDVLSWSEDQAELLRQLAAGRPANAPIDWPNIIAEIESVGRSELSRVRSLLTQAILHDLKAEAWPLALAVPHWRAEARVMRRDAMRTFTPSMRQRLDINEIYADALVGLPDSMDGNAPLAVPSTCPVSLDELLSADAPRPT